MEDGGVHGLSQWNLTIFREEEWLKLRHWVNKKGLRTEKISAKNIFSLSCRGHKKFSAFPSPSIPAIHWPLDSAILECASRWVQYHHGCCCFADKLTVEQVKPTLLLRPELLLSLMYASWDHRTLDLKCLFVCVDKKRFLNINPQRTLLALSRKSAWNKKSRRGKSADVKWELSYLTVCSINIMSPGVGDLCSISGGEFRRLCFCGGLR